MANKEDNPLNTRIYVGDDLVKVLGFKNRREFNRARETGSIGVRLYPVPNRPKGVYALARDVTDWKKTQKQLGASPQGGRK